MSENPALITATAGRTKYRLVRRALLGLVLLVVLIGGGAWLMHAGIDPVEEREQLGEPMPRKEVLLGIRTWGHHLEHAWGPGLAAVSEDLIVVDPDPEFVDAGRDLGQNGPTLTNLQRKDDGGRRLVLAYLSIGEAEEQRSYWRDEWLVPQVGNGSPEVVGPLNVALSGRRALRAPTSSAPAWLGSESGEWKGKFAVRFWSSDWQSNLLGRPEALLDRVLAAGFDGVYLDRTSVHAAWVGENPNSEQDMVALIERISSYARARNPDFVVAMQNGEELLGHRRVRAALDAVAKEDLLYGIAGAEQPNPDGEIAASLKLLRKASREGVTVLVIEDIRADVAIAKARRRLEAEGFVPAFASRTFDHLRYGD